MKEKFNLLDIRAMIKDLRSSLLGLRVLNVYDITPKLYFFKLASTEDQKLSLVMESGSRFNLTRFSKTKSGDKLPSTFAMKLRQHLKGKRLDVIRQLGGDRIVDFRFGSGSAACHVILEMFAQGNLILTDNNYKILTLLRVFIYSDGTPVRNGEYYPVSTAVVSLSMSSIDCREKFVDWMNTTVMEEERRIAQQAIEPVVAETEAKAPPEKGKKSKKDKVQKITMKTILISKSSPFSCIGPSLVDHCLMTSLIPGNLSMTSITPNPLTSLQIDALLHALTVDSLEILDGIDMVPQKGFIVLTEKSDVSDEASVVYDEFVPLILAQHNNRKTIEFTCFNDAVDYYYQKFDDQKSIKGDVKKKDDIQTKVDRIQEDHTRRMNELDGQCKEIAKKALVLEQHSDEVDKVNFVLTGALSHGLEWDDVDALIDDEKTKHNPIASLIERVIYSKNIVRVRLKDLSNMNDENDNEDEDSKQEVVKIDVNFNLTAFGNVRLLHEQRRRMEEKLERTRKSSLEAVSNAQRAADEQSRRIFSGPTVEQRKIFWFEKFHWFITSDNYLVISGRDAQQNEILVKRYMRTGDAYVHADIHGSASCIIRNKNPIKPISPTALLEAGSLSVCRSAAWKSKIITSAWWVHANQVSKSAPSGEYLTVGSFMIRGRKNFLPPCHLEMGIGIMFRLEDSCIASHRGERRDKGEAMSDLSRVQIEVDENVVGLDATYIDVADPIIKTQAAPKKKKKSGDEKKVEVKQEAADDDEDEDVGDDNKETNKQQAVSKALSASTKRVMSRSRKKKLLKYKDQDEEERRLAMISLGHKPREDDVDEVKKRQMEEDEQVEKMKKAGVDVLTTGSGDDVEIQQIVACMDPAMLSLLHEMPSIDLKIFDVYELRYLCRFQPQDAMIALRVLEQMVAHQADCNKSGLLAKIIQQVIEHRLSSRNVIDVDSIVSRLVEGDAVVADDVAEAWNDDNDDGATAEEGGEEEDVGVDALELDKLTSVPTALDLNLFAVAVCAPYLSMKDFKYKIKIVPGNQRKGHASRLAKEIFQAGSTAVDDGGSKSQMDLIRQVSENEMVTVLLGDVRLQSIGSRVTINTRFNKKKKKKNDDDDDDDAKVVEVASSGKKKTKSIPVPKKLTTNELLMQGLAGGDASNSNKSSITSSTKKVNNKRK